jgi:hypothetical protein
VYFASRTNRRVVLCLVRVLSSSVDGIEEAFFSTFVEREENSSPCRINVKEQLWMMSSWKMRTSGVQD